METRHEKENKKMYETAEKVARILAESDISYRQVDDLMYYLKEILKVTC